MSTTDKVIIGIILALILGFYVYHKKRKKETAEPSAIPTSQVNDPVLKFGSNSDDVRKLQEVLNERIMFDKIHNNETVPDTLFVNGVFGALTLTAVEFYTGEESIRVSELSGLIKMENDYQ